MKQNLIQSHIYHGRDFLFYLPSGESVKFSPEYIFSNKSISLNNSNQNNGIGYVIEKSSSDIVFALQHPPKAAILSTTLITALISTLSASTAAFIYNKIHWRSVIKRERQTKLLENILDILNELREDSISYWLKGYSKKLAKSLLEEEMKIKTNLRLIDYTISLYVSGMSFFKRKRVYEKLKSYHGEIYDIITGDDFESIGRKQDKNKVALISTKFITFRVSLIGLKV